MVCLLAVLLLGSFFGCAEKQAEIEGTKINLSDSGITVDGKDITNDNSQAVYSENDIIYYPEGKDFTFGDGTKEEEHSQEEADSHTVVHITNAGRYVLSGKLSAGQIAVDLGEDAEDIPRLLLPLFSTKLILPAPLPLLLFSIMFMNAVLPMKKKQQRMSTHQMQVQM